MKEGFLQVLMFCGMLVGFVGAARHVMYQFNIKGIRRSANFMKVQIGLYLLFGLIFLTVVAMQKWV